MPHRSETSSVNWTKVNFECAIFSNLSQVPSASETLNVVSDSTCSRQVDSISSKGKYSNEDPTSFCKSCQDSSKKKAVRFADNCGGILEFVRIVTEPLDCPPFISTAVINRHKRAAKLGANYSTSIFDPNSNEEIRSNCSWKINFIQPASDYIKFLERLDTQKVALENVMIKNEECKIIGTIRVANIIFKKLVHVRVTFDEWTTHHDCQATYQTSPSKNYDTYCFNIEIPSSIKENRIEFCIVYFANDIEYWDSNNGINYSVIRLDNNC